MEEKEEEEECHLEQRNSFLRFPSKRGRGLQRALVLQQDHRLDRG